MTLTLTEKDQSIISQVAAKITSELVAAAHAHNDNVTTDDLVSDFAAHFGTVNEALLEGITGQVVAAAFPGSVEQPVAAYVPAATVSVTTPQPPVHSAPAAIPGATDGDPATAALWAEYFNDKTRWWDNRVGKIPKSQGGEGRNVKGPDFKHKDDDSKALWVVGRGNPSWVAERLAQG